MRTRQTITVIGKEAKLVSPLVKGLADGNYRLLLCTKSPAESAGLLATLPAKTKKELELMDCSFDGCWEADIIITAIAPGEESGLAEKIRVVANQKLLISLTEGLSEAELERSYESFSRHFPYSRLVQVFQPSEGAGWRIRASKPEFLEMAAEVFRDAGIAIEQDSELRAAV